MTEITPPIDYDIADVLAHLAERIRHAGTTPHRVVVTVQWPAGCEAIVADAAHGIDNPQAATELVLGCWMHRSHRKDGPLDVTVFCGTAEPDGAAEARLVAELAAVRARRTQQPAEPPMVVDEDGDRWTRGGNGLYYCPAHGLAPRTLAELRDSWGPLTVPDPEPAADAEPVAPAPEAKPPVVIDGDGDRWRRGHDGAYRLGSGNGSGAGVTLDHIVRHHPPITVPAPEPTTWEPTP
jgi:hypothetical protein